jgi:acyl carrier protein
VDMIMLEKELRSFIVDNYMLGRSEGLNNDDSFLETGIIDSTGVLELVAFLQETYGITVEDEELTPDNLDSITKVAAYISRKLNSIERVDGEFQPVATGVWKCG